MESKNLKGSVSAEQTVTQYTRKVGSRKAHWNSVRRFKEHSLLNQQVAQLHQKQRDVVAFFVAVETRLHCSAPS